MNRFDELEKHLEFIFARARTYSPSELEEISNDHSYLMDHWQTYTPSESDEEMLKYLLHARKCIDCVDYMVRVKRMRYLEEQDTALIQH